MIGTTIDFYVHATAAVLVFPHLFFLAGNEATTLLASAVSSPALLVAMRLAQGFALGGEWSGDHVPAALGEPILGTFYMLAADVPFYLMTRFPLRYGRAATTSPLPGPGYDDTGFVLMMIIGVVF